MTNLVLDQNYSVTLNSDELANQNYSIEVTKSCNAVFTVEGNNPFTLEINANVKDNVNFTVLVINSNNSELTVNDTYRLGYFSNGTIAYSQLNNKPVVTNNNYFLEGEGASLKVLSVSISDCKKQFNQTTDHLAANTSASIDNYGIVLKDGNCKMVVKNIVRNGIHNCSTHQTSRLLTYDKSSVGKILPILQIDDNEVSASHACSLGQPDENQIYYLMSRGINYSEALTLISKGYLLPITTIVDDENLNDMIRNEIESKVTLNV